MDHNKQAQSKGQSNYEAWWININNYADKEAYKVIKWDNEQRSAEWHKILSLIHI